ncbi:PilZ domain-containing protein [Sphingomonas sp. 1P06PA]|uniref:PilZ domain-containing protein n=1 Tax=Sphingomonas sp. 1P06PA TaxID=554121 RepID=UPI0039A4C3A1
MKNRRDRVTTLIPARVRTDNGWSDGIIRNISPNGAMIEIANPPGRGSYVELRRATSVIIGRIIWSHAGRFGMVTRETIDLASMLDPSRSNDSNVQAMAERRILRRNEGARSPYDFAAAGRAFEFSSILVAVALSSILIFNIVQSVASLPAAAAVSAMRASHPGID